MSSLIASVMNDWERQLRESLPLYGHRNWIVIADAAYPAQSKPAIETVLAPGNQIAVVRKALTAIRIYRHIRARVYTDKELRFLAESDAPGVTAYRQQLDALFQDFSRSEILHEQIIARLDQSARLFRILIIKTEMTIPYTSIFFELECGYSSAEAEERLRLAMQVSEIS
ncbi:MAG TPA: RbsD/FucU domain-containing protein [Terracidiphilus sp.]|nr:RbsD/FucU domain-containing protein [Terracidiphilus sp.]